jgi:hypothetical protein
MSRTIWQYNSEGKVVSIRSEDKASTGWRLNKKSYYMYDTMGRLIVYSKDGSSSRDTITYDNLGRVSSVSSGLVSGSTYSMIFRQIYTYESSTALESNDEAVSFNSISAFPNPLNPSTSLTLKLATAGKINCAIYDVSGRIVRTIAKDYMNAGTHTLRWDGRTENGKAAPSNMYFAVLSTERGTTKTRILLLK